MAKSEDDRIVHLSLDALYSIASTINGSLELPVVLCRALDAVLGAFDFSSGVVRLLDPPSGELRLTAEAGVPTELTGDLGQDFRVGDAPFGLAVQRRSLVVVEDLLNSPYADSPWGRHGYRTFVSVPLQSRGMLLGCLDLFSTQIRPLRPDEGELLTALGNQISMAVANAELYTAAQRKIAYLAALQQSSQDIGPAPDLEQVRRLTTQRMAQLLGLERTILLERDPATEEVAVAAGYGCREEVSPQCRAPRASLPLADAVMRERQTRVSTDPAGDGLLPQELASTERIHDALVLPLVAHDEVLGLLIGDRGDQPLSLSADEIELATIFAHQAAVWIASARLFARQQTALALNESVEAKFRRLVESAPDGIVIVDPSGQIMIVNSQAEQMFGYSRESLLGRPVEILLPEHSRAAHQSHRNLYQAEPRTRPMGRGLELYGRRRDGTEFPAEISLSHTGTQEEMLVTAVVRDITERREAERELHRQAQVLRAQAELLELAHDTIIVRDVEGRVAFWNRGAEQMYGWRREEVMGQLEQALLQTRWPESWEEAECAIRETGGWEGELIHTRRDGTQILVASRQALQRDEAGQPVSILEINRDITEQRRAEEERSRLLTSEQEKSEQLKLSVREAHHRIKNNLQAITALLYLELSAGNSDEHESHDGAIRESMERIQAIAVVHDLLSQDEDVQTVDIRAVVERLVPMVLRSSGLSSETVQTSLSVPPVPLSSKKATALALIVNELVSNAAKHAFRGRRGGRLQIRLGEANGGMLLRIQDDGPGLPSDFDLARSANVGLEVVRTLVERDLDGRLTLDGDSGLTAAVWFPW
jgi:PAS domain S-box-containing protein